MRYQAVLFLIALMMLGAPLVEISAQEKKQAEESVKKATLSRKIKRLDFKEARIVDAIRLISKVSNTNIVASKEAGEKSVTIYMQEVTVKHAIETIGRISGLWYSYDEENNTYRLLTVEEYQQNLIVEDQEKIRIFTLLYPNPVTIARMVEDLYGDRVILSYGLDKDDDAFELDIDNRASSNSSDNNSTNNFTRSTTDTGRFSRSVPNSTTTNTPNTQLTADQIALLEQQLRQQGNQAENNAALLNRLSRRKPPIFISVLRSQNVIAVRTSDTEAVKEIEKLIKELDKPTPQVLLEMKIIEVTLGDDFKSIFDLEISDGRETFGPASSTPNNPLDLTAAVGVNQILGLGNFGLEPSSTLIYQFLNNDVRARIQLLETNNRVDVLSTPMVLASNDRPSRLFVGEERVITIGAETQIVTTDGGVTTTVIQPTTEVRDIGNSLIVLPKINADGTVTMVIQQDASTVNVNGSSLLVAGEDGSVERVAIDTVNTANLDVTVTAKNRLTVAVGGLIRTEVGDQEEKVPLLGDIPIIGQAFRKEEKVRAKKELVLLITPHLIMTKEDVEKVKNRVRDMSHSPYYTEGDQALDRFFEDVPEHLEPFEWMEKSFEEIGKALDPNKQEQTTTPEGQN